MDANSRADLYCSGTGVHGASVTNDGSLDHQPVAPARQQPHSERLEQLEQAIEEIYLNLDVALMYEAAPDMDRIKVAHRWAIEARR